MSDTIVAHVTVNTTVWVLTCRSESKWFRGKAHFELRNPGSDYDKVLVIQTLDNQPIFECGGVARMDRKTAAIGFAVAFKNLVRSGSPLLRDLPVVQFNDWSDS